jgi:dinuclear metal center YbgI/SA1388 family protein
MDWGDIKVKTATFAAYHPDMAELSEIVTFLNDLLRPADFTDSAFNGLQVEGRATIKKVAVAVDCGESIIDQAISAGAQLLIVHHGLLWGSEMPLVGSYGRKVRKLIQAGCSLYGSHLPLDAHPEAGNNSLLARHFGLSSTGMFCGIGGQLIGVTARTDQPQPAEYFTQKAQTLPGFGPCLWLPFGPSSIETVGIVSGSGASAIEEASALGLDLLISGEPKQHVYHQCKELHLNALFAGHYATETLGVLGLGLRLEERFGITKIFIDEPTGI